MSIHNYYCDKCEIVCELELNPVEVNAKGFMNRDAGYYTKIMVSSLSEEEIKALPEDKDPRDYEKFVEIKYKSVPDSIKCFQCNKKAGLMVEQFEGWCKGNCFTNRERERKFYQNGMNKFQAERFYKESIDASNERHGTMKEVYKKVSPDMEHYAKHGLAKPCKDPGVKAEKLKRINAEISKPYIAKLKR